MKSAMMVSATRLAHFGLRLWVGWFSELATGWAAEWPTGFREISAVSIHAELPDPLVDDDGKAITKSACRTCPPERSRKTV